MLIPDSYKEFGLKGFTTEMRTGLPNCTNEKVHRLRNSSMLNNGFTVLQEDLWN